MKEAEKGGDHGNGYSEKERVASFGELDEGVDHNYEQRSRGVGYYIEFKKIKNSVFHTSLFFGVNRSNRSKFDNFLYHISLVLSIGKTNFRLSAFRFPYFAFALSEKNYL